MKDPKSMEASAEAELSGMRGMSNTSLIAIVVVIIVVVGGLALFRDKIFGSSSKSASSSTAKFSGYQSVFLTNGQVYFGKVSEAESEWVTVKDIYYLQVVQAPIQGSKEQQTQAQPQISLVKLGNELHGPLDEMKISQKQILFIEDMKDSSQVMQAIKNYQKNPTPAPAAQGGTGTQTPPATTGGTTNNTNSNQTQQQGQ